MKRLLITGKSGQVGNALCSLAWPKDVAIEAPSRKELDLCDPHAIQVAIAEGDYCGVINCAAWTAVDAAETDPAAAFATNALAPAVLAAATARCGIPIIHVSTDYVFDGSKTDPYLETDPISPLNVYGASKAAGEIAVRTANPHHVIVRTSWVYSCSGRNFLTSMLSLAQKRQSLSIVDDQTGAPTSAADLAAALQLVMQRLLDDDEAPKGTVHFSNAGRTTWHDFAAAIFAKTSALGYPTPTLSPISSREYGSSVRRPANSILSLRKFEEDYGMRPRHWQTALADMLSKEESRALLKKACQA